MLSFKTFFMWLMISVYQGSSAVVTLRLGLQPHIRLGAAIMIMSLVLFENEFLNIVSISFTALILNELIMVALEITTWYALHICKSIIESDACARHLYMVISEVVTLFFYVISIAFLPEYFGTSFP